jgi:putative DNA primase/helicase
VASEADESAQLDVALVKELTGGDTHRARFLYQGEFEFKPQFKLFLVTNKIPPIRETTYAIWDRLHYIPFEWRVPDELMDRKLPLKLLGELPGILAKAVKSCLDWQKDGLQPPEKVLYAGKQLYKEMDTIGQFLSECIEQVEDETTTTAHKDLYQIFVHWCKTNGIHKAPSSKWVASELRNKKFVSDRLTDNVLHWRGLKANATAQYELGHPEKNTGRGEKF